MREHWRRDPPLSFPLALLDTLILPVAPGRRVVAAVPAEGGLANTNIRVRLDDGGSLRVRVPTRDPDGWAREAALHRTMAGIAPGLLYAAGASALGHPVLILEWVEGERLEQIAPAMSDKALMTLARKLGTGLARIHGMRFAATGALDAELAVAAPFSVGADGLTAFLERCLIQGRGGERIGADLTQAILALIAREGNRLDMALGPPCLVHDDFNGSNILIRDGRGAAVLDWEFAFAGDALFDFATITRPPLGRRAGFTDALAAGYRAAGGILPDDWLRLARLVDLYNWADFLARPDPGQALIRDATQMIAAALDLFPAH
jgi:aminoglycoside phosphotransferase (APT) family kinase protein